MIDNEGVVKKWRVEVVRHAEEIDGESDKGGHDWHSLWTGFVIGIERSDLSSWERYMELGFPVEAEATNA